MANVFVGTPPVWIIDTASATPVSTDFLRVALIVWEAGTVAAAGDECKVTDAAGNVVYDVFGTGADFEEFPRTLPRFFSMSGLAVPTLAHGKVYIYMQ
jgi:hypothetical protein